MINPAPAGI